MGCALAILALGAACAVETQRPDWGSGGDHKRDLAKLAPLNRAVTDSVNADKGDHTDWRYIQVPKEGKLKISVSVDNLRVPATILFVDGLGQPIERKRVNGKDMLYEWESEVQEGRYFVKMQTARYQTVYTVSNEYVPKPEPEPEPVAAAPKKKRRPKKTDVAPTPAATAQPAPGEPGSGIIIVHGTILNKIPWADGKKTRVTFDRGSSSGIRAGATVAISNGPTMKVKQVYDGSSVGFVKVKAATITEGTKVVITSKTGP
jgi:hypothetical protein